MNPSYENYLEVGRIYEKKLDDFSAALAQYEKAAAYESEDPSVYYHMAVCYEELKQYSNAVHFYKLSLEGEGRYGWYGAKAYKKLARMYEEGVSVKKDLHKAFELYLNAAEMNDDEAGFIVGTMYESGIGIEKNYKEALKWYRQGADYRPARDKLEALHEPFYAYIHDDTPCEEPDANRLAVPDDFSVYYSEGPRHVHWGPTTSLHVRPDGRFEIKERIYSSETFKEETNILKKGTIPLANVKRIYLKIVGCDFFNLEESYDDPNIRDGSSEYISVKADWKTHSVSVAHYYVKRFSSVRRTLFKEVPGVTELFLR